MARYLCVKAGIVVNIVEAAVLPMGEGGAECFLSVTGLESVGDAFDSVAARNQSDRGVASGYFDATDPLAKALRAEASVLVDEINSLRQWITSFKAAIAASTSFADMKTRIAALGNMPDRTMVQAKTAIQSKINTGAVDA